MNKLKKFKFNNNNIQVVDRKGEPWFLAKEVCDVLGLGNSRQAVSRLDPDEKSSVILNDGTDGNPNKTIVNESGFYSLVLNSRKKEAKEFRKWVTNKVLPSIRKTGAYKLPTQQQLLADSKENRKSLTSQWQDHGANKPHHFMHLTRAEYQSLFDDSKKKKAEMNKKELTMLSMLEFAEGLKLDKQPDIVGYHKLKKSVSDTGLSIGGMLEEIINRPVLLKRG